MILGTGYFNYWWSEKNDDDKILIFFLFRSGYEEEVIDGKIIISDWSKVPDDCFPYISLSLLLCCKLLEISFFDFSVDVRNSCTAIQRSQMCSQFQLKKYCTDVENMKALKVYCPSAFSIHVLQTSDVCFIHSHITNIFFSEFKT